MYLDRAYKDSQFLYSPTPGESKLIFLGYFNGQSGDINLRYKDSTGFHNICCGQGNSGCNCSSDIPIVDQQDLLEATTIQQAIAQLAKQIVGVKTIVKLITGQQVTQVVSECL